MILLKKFLIKIYKLKFIIIKFLFYLNNINIIKFSQNYVFFKNIFKF